MRLLLCLCYPQPLGGNQKARFQSTLRTPSILQILHQVSHPARSSRMLHKVQKFLLSLLNSFLSLTVKRIFVNQLPGSCPPRSVCFVCFSFCICTVGSSWSLPAPGTKFWTALWCNHLLDPLTISISRSFCRQVDHRKIEVRERISRAARSNRFHLGRFACRNQQICLVFVSDTDAVVLCTLLQHNFIPVFSCNARC